MEMPLHMVKSSPVSTLLAVGTLSLKQLTTQSGELELTTSTSETVSYCTYEHVNPVRQHREHDVPLCVKYPDLERREEMKSEKQGRGRIVLQALTTALPLIYWQA